ncbi:hypothetical protein CFR78_07845 [Komagataeibacter rhaeticus]|uniref:Uncharacterized protein n=1 Tax=Komagataeibacter rhaeticus TaxID=215221 RepID=A0A181CDI0_9PROT|nr:hypothetical protein [Komagataeibacter rhaeticus]ATU71675.1 hypothetical protein CT154_01290 [Komagataeibacter xylinus]MBL7240627.1 hypothetical protein [Komagataeibacter rhaeticus]MDT8873157.1 hypothetical protein [Komagataeibacter rhaeticus]PYD53854.1 hypothetical protein CFR78_07845 [Komagataeibacter rhaeticus]QIP36260.1 hypothetical protein GWK63_12910 [Komagataeibacter rhaeticus]
MTPAVETIASPATSPAVAAGLPLVTDDIPTRSQTTRMIYSRHRRALRDYARTLSTPTEPS